MKKLSIIFALIFALLALTGCGDDDIYREPGTGTTLKPKVTTEAPVSDDVGSYSADPDGDVADTTDGGVFEEGMEDLESGVDEGLEDIGDGAERVGDDIKDMTDGMRPGSSDDDGSARTDTEASGGTDSEGLENRTDEGDSHGATNGNAH